MPKKSSKTAHVLNLISPTKEDSLPTEENSLDPESQEATTEAPKSKPEKMENILHLSESTEDLSNLIQQNLEQELNAVQAEQEEAFADALVDTPAEPDAPVTEPEESTASEAPEPSTSAAPTPAEEAPEPNTSAAPTTTAATEESSSSEEEFYYLNVFEQIVKNNVKEYLERFDVCTCSRCVADATALALTNLPSKYIVMEYDNTAPLLSFFEHQFQTQILSELTKACLTVHENPRHKR